MRFIGRVLVELGRGLGLIVRDIHRALYRRLRARVWWIYLGVAFVIALWQTGQLWNLVASILTLIIVLAGLWLIIRAPFRGGKKAGSK